MAEQTCFIIAVVGTFVIGVIVVVGIIGNSLTFVVFWKGNFKSSTSLLLLTLSLIDSAALLIVFALYTAKFDVYTEMLPRNANVRAYLRVCVIPLACTAETATIWLTVLIAVNRYIIVCLPLRASQWCTLSKVKIQLAVVLVSVVLCNIPEYLRYRVVHYTWNNGTSYVPYFKDIGIQSFPKFYYVYDNVLTVLVLWCLPLFVLTLLTIRLIKAMKAHRRMQAEMQRQHNQPDNSMTFSLVIVVIVFIICKAPNIIWFVMRQYMTNGPFMCCMYLMFATLLALNSAVNFIIYIVINDRFRAVLVGTVCRRRTETQPVTVNMTVKTERDKGDPVDSSDTRL